jgi:hypothetical protein
VCAVSIKLHITNIIDNREEKQRKGTRKEKRNQEGEKEPGRRKGRGARESVIKVAIEGR